MFRSVPYVIALASACVSAQVDIETVRAFMPLDVGDVWEYAYHWEECDHVAYGGACRSRDETFTYRVVDEVVRDGDTLAVIDGRGTRALFGVRSDGSGWVSETVEPGDGSSPVRPPFPSYSTFLLMVNRGPMPWTFNAGGEEYTTEALAYYPPPHVLARGVGLTEHSRSWQGTGGSRWSYKWTLSGATVGGVNYGGFVTASEPPTGAELFDFSVGPNPTTGSLTVRARLRTASEVRVEIIDALGRKAQVVEARSTGTTVNVPIDLAASPAGVYVVRFFVDGRPVTSTTVTHVPAR